MSCQPPFTMGDGNLLHNFTSYQLELATPEPAMYSHHISSAKLLAAVALCVNF